jgi:hypothetical protein
MIFHSQGRLTVLATLAALALPALSQAGVLSFKNDTNAPLVVQVITLVNNVARANRAQIVRPGQSYGEAALPGNKQILIADARQPTLPLCNETIAQAMGDQYFSIQVDMAPLPQNQFGGQVQALPRVKLVAIPPPVKPAARIPAPPPRRPPVRQ